MRIDASVLTSRCVLFCAAILSTSHLEARGDWRAVRGPDLGNTFVDHELADGVHYAYRFKADGRLSGFVMGRKVNGTWRISGDQVCWSTARRGAAEECYQVESRGRSIRLLRDGYEAFSATLTKPAQDK
jgi:hypothetical protein